MSLIVRQSLLQLTVSIIATMTATLGAVAYLRRVRAERPAIGTFNFRDVATLFVFIITLPLIYLALPRFWLTTFLAFTFGSALAIGLRPVLRPTTLWVFIGTLLGANIWVARTMLGTQAGWQLYWVLVGTVVLISAISVANLYVQGGMQLRHAAWFVLLLAAYDFYFSQIVPLTPELADRFQGYPLNAAVGFRFDVFNAAIGIGDLLAFGIFGAATYKAYGTKGRYDSRSPSSSSSAPPHPVSHHSSLVRSPEAASTSSSPSKHGSDHPPSSSTAGCAPTTAPNAPWPNSVPTPTTCPGPNRQPLQADPPSHAQPPDPHTVNALGHHPVTQTQQPSCDHRPELFLQPERENSEPAPNDAPNHAPSPVRTSTEQHLVRVGGSASIARSVLVLPADTELVAGRVGHDAEPVRRVVMKPQSLGAELLGAVDPLPRVVNEDVDVQPVLDLLGLWDTLQVEHGEPGRWLEMDPTSVNVSGNSIPKKP